MGNKNNEVLGFSLCWICVNKLICGVPMQLSCKKFIKDKENIKGDKLKCNG
jgi:hypothetical protein